MRFLLDDGFGKILTINDDESVFDDVDVLAAGGTQESTDDFLFMPSQNPTLNLRFTTGTSLLFDVVLRIKLSARSATIIEEVFIARNLSSGGGRAGIVLPIREAGAGNPPIYGWGSIVIVNNDPMTDLTHVSGLIHQEIK